MGVDMNRLGIDALCGCTYLLEERTKSGAIGSVAGLYCDVVSNSIIVVVWGAVLQNGKQVVAVCMSLVDKAQETDV